MEFFFKHYKSKKQNMVFPFPKQGKKIHPSSFYHFILLRGAGGADFGWEAEFTLNSSLVG